MNTKNITFGFSQWKKETPVVIDNIYHVYLFLWSVWLLIAGSKYITIPDHYILVATWISGLMLPVIYSFCKCFGLTIPSDIPAEHTVTPADPKIQQVVDKIDAVTNEVSKVNTQAVRDDIAAGDVSKAVNDIQPSLQPLMTDKIVLPDNLQSGGSVVLALQACKSLDTLALLYKSIPPELATAAIVSAYTKRQTELENLESLK